VPESPLTNANVVHLEHVHSIVDSFAIHHIVFVPSPAHKPAEPGTAADVAAGCRSRPGAVVGVPLPLSPERVTMFCSLSEFPESLSARDISPLLRHDAPQATGV
jgi:hypothetical protein